MVCLPKKIFALSLGLMVAALFAAMPASAQPEQPIKVEVGKAKVLRMEQRPEVIFIANPAIVDLVIEQGDVLFLVGRQTGETNMRLLDSNGDVLMNTNITVVPQEGRHMTLHRGGRETTFSCNPRCAGVRNPHAAGASVGGADVNLAEGKEEKTRGPSTPSSGGGRPKGKISPTVKGPGLVR